MASHIYRTGPDTEFNAVVLIVLGILVPLLAYGFYVGAASENWGAAIFFAVPLAVSLYYFTGTARFVFSKGKMIFEGTGFRYKGRFYEWRRFNVFRAEYPWISLFERASLAPTLKDPLYFRPHYQGRHWKPADFRFEDRAEFEIAVKKLGEKLQRMKKRE